MRFSFAALAAFLFFQPVFSATKEAALLSKVEGRYRGADSVQMDVDKTVKMKLLEKEKHSKGKILVKKGGRLRWETTEPDHSLIVINPKVVWLVDFPAEEDEKVAVLKAKHPQKSQPQALVTFLMGRGRMTDEFKISSEKVQGDQVEFTLKPKRQDGQVLWLSVTVDRKEMIIKKLSFEDSVSNSTYLDFSSVVFNKDVDDKLFEFTPPKDSDVTNID